MMKMKDGRWKGHCERCYGEWIDAVEREAGAAVVAKRILDGPQVVEADGEVAGVPQRELGPPEEVQAAADDAVLDDVDEDLHVRLVPQGPQLPGNGLLLGRPSLPVPQDLVEVQLLLGEEGLGADGTADAHLRDVLPPRAEVGHLGPELLPAAAYQSSSSIHRHRHHLSGPASRITV